MALHAALAVAALAASALLLVAGVARPLAVVALLASAVEVALAFAVIRLHVGGVPLGLALGLALAIPGLLAWFRATSKAAVSASAIVALAGALQVFAALGARV